MRHRHRRHYTTDGSSERSRRRHWSVVAAAFNPFGTRRNKNEKTGGV